MFNDDEKPIAPAASNAGILYVDQLMMISVSISSQQMGK
jgi:hypothetical protein